MSDLTYKGVTLVEQVLPSNVRATRHWRGEQGVVELEVWSNEIRGTYTAYARVYRPHPEGQGTLRLISGGAFGPDIAEALDGACAAFVARADKPFEQQHRRERLIRPQDVAPMRGIVQRPRDPGDGEISGTARPRVR